MARAHGIDISKWQRFFDPAVNPDDINFIVLRVSYGLMKDEAYDKLVEAIQPVPIRGTYHYFSSSSPWQTQADHFLDLVRDKGFHFHALDIESGYNKKSAGFAQSAQKWLQYVADATGQRVLLYTNPNIYNSWLTPYGDWMADWPFWVAQYWNEPHRDRDPGLPRGRKDWKFYQYSADVPPNRKGKEYGVGSTNIDLNVYNGTVEELRSWLGLDVEKEPEEPTVEPIEVGELDFDELAEELVPLIAPLLAEQLFPLIEKLVEDKMREE
jgi:GH25 family lysozyme M1 (1,4-beta-N-acetylmuramidase)